jgi:hypothetical protein
LLLIVPTGKVSESPSTALGTLTERDSGLGDLMLSFVYGIRGSLSLSPPEHGYESPAGKTATWQF